VVEITFGRKAPTQPIEVYESEGRAVDARVIPLFIRQIGNAEPQLAYARVLSADGEKLLLETDEKNKANIYYVPYSPNKANIAVHFDGLTWDKALAAQKGTLQTMGKPKPTVAPGGKAVQPEVKAKETTQASAKITTRETIKGLVGKPGYEGYTEQELVDYYLKQEYTIK